MASFFEHIGTDVQDVAEADALAAQAAAELAQAAAETAKTSAESSAANAATSATNAATSESNASTSAAAAAGSESTVTAKANEAAASATTATTKASESATSATDAATSATNAASSASTSTTQATNSATSATSSLTAQTAAEAAQTAAETAETNAAASATSAASSASTATTQASTSTTQATNSAASATTATTKATESAASATTAATKATEAAASATTAATKATEATAARDDIVGLTAATGAAGSSASYNASTGVLTVPRGDTGATGAAGADGTTFDTNVLTVDGTNNRIGVNDTTPSVSLDAGANTDALHVPVGTTAQRPTGAAGRFRYNSSLAQFEGYTDAWGAIGGGGGTNTFTADSFTGNGSTTAFALSQTISSENNLLVFIEGIFQQQDAFSIATSGGTTTLTFSAAPANGNSILIYSVAAAVSGSNLNIDSMTGDGSDTTLALSIAPVNENNTQVFVDGVYQSKANYSISGTTLTFSTAPPSGAAVEVMTMTQTEINVPVDGTITSAKLSGDLVTPGALTVTGAFTSLGIDDNANATAITIDASENVGIGTISPWETASIPFDSKLSFGSSAYPLSISRSSAGTLVTTIEDGYDVSNTRLDFKMRAGSANEVIPLSLISSGNVGIGTSSPRSLLDLDGGSETQLRLQTTNSGSTTSDGLLISLDSSANAKSYIWNYENAEMIFGTNNTEAGRFDPNGHLMLGVSSISDINTGYKSINVSSNQIMGNPTGPDWYLNLNSYYSSSNDYKFKQNGHAAGMYHTGDGALVFRRSSGSGTAGNAISWSESMRLTNDGKLGVNNNLPASTLDLAGAVTHKNGANDLAAHTYSTYASFVNSGKIDFTAGYSGTLTAGRVVSFIYEATSWKSWQATIKWSSTQGFAHYEAGGYWNNSGSQYKEEIRDSNNATTLTISNNGQHVILALTMNASHTHPLLQVTYAQSGGDGSPTANKAKVVIS